MLSASQSVQRVLDHENISLPELQEMVSKSAITSQRGFDRRYFNWLFKIDGDTVTAMVERELTEKGSGREIMYENCDCCDGKGCKLCGWNGQIIRRIHALPRRA